MLGKGRILLSLAATTDEVHQNRTRPVKSAHSSSTSLHNVMSNRFSIKYATLQIGCFSIENVCEGVIVISSSLKM